MIHVLELPRGQPARTWFAFDAADLLRKVAATEPQPWQPVHADIRLEDLLERAGQDPDADELTLFGLVSQALLLGRGDCRIYWTEAEATSAFERAHEPAWQGEGWRARLALRDQLVALDVLAEDL